jgi:hypothetical protein
MNSKTDMQVVNVDVVQLHVELGIGIQRGLLRAPVKTVSLVADKVAHVLQVGAIGQGSSGA